MKKLTALGANIFAGGFSLGVSKHFQLLGHLEHDEWGAAVARKNLKVPIYIGTDQWPEKMKMDFLYSNPPCAIWSAASGRNLGGKGDTWRSDPRLQRIRDIFGLVERYRPSVWCWESVCNAFNRGRDFVEELADEAERLGYSATYLLVDAQWLGSCQTRKRFFLVLHNIEIDWDKARPQFVNTVTPAQLLKGVKPKKELLTNISKWLENDILKFTKPGEKLAKCYDRLPSGKRKINPDGSRKGAPSFLKSRLDIKRPTLGVVFGDSLFHHKEHRLLAINEIAALYGFPQSWDWISRRSLVLPQQGVLPCVGEWLARNVAAAIRIKKRIRKPQRFLVDFRLSPGTIQDVRNLPADVDLDWKPKAAGSRPKLRHAGRSAGTPARSILRVESLAEATRRGIPDKNSQVLIRTAMKGWKRGLTPASSGLLIRALLLEKVLSADDIVAMVLKKYEGRKTTVADVAWHRDKMRRAGMAV